SQLTHEQLSATSELLAAHEDEFREVLHRSSWLESKVSEGGTSLARVSEQLALARTALGEGARP
ncbi:MAG TPA: hypothetical protein VII01_09850, partial [Solirubrobacteraceae bacterium]